MDQPLTILYFNEGNAFYLKYSIAQTVERCPSARVILLGDESNSRYSFVEHHRIRDYSQSAEQFAGIYEHLSTNDREFDLACFRTWFVFSEFVRREKIRGPVVCLDHDILLYEDLAPLLDGSFDVATTKLVGNQYTVFARAELLLSFTEFIAIQYSSQDGLKRLRTIYRTGISPVPLPGGWICDMTLLGLFVLPFVEQGRYRDLGVEWEGGVFDYAFHQAEGYAFNRYKSIKKIWIRKGIAWGKRDGQWVRFRGLHFQVGTKVFLPHYYTGKRWFADKPRHEWIRLRGYLTSLLKALLEQFNLKAKDV
jgi:hypothetical protein